jgi:pimeloyl-ACP methyl ester carboxylesterase
VSHDSPSNAGFRALCESSIVRGRIDDCSSGACRATWGTFPSTSPEAVWDAVFAELDADRNGVIDDRDPVFELDVLGFSWGGVNALALARLMQVDPRMIAPRSIRRLVLIDAYQPLASLWITPNVERTISFRHSRAPATDCSHGAPLGPYLGLAPTCGRDQECFDYDFSLSPRDTFAGMLGSEVGHCDVPTAAAANVAQVLQDAPLRGAPREVPVAR